MSVVVPVFIDFLTHTTFLPLVKQVFKDMEFLGWYTTGGPPDQSDIHIHKQVSGRFFFFFF